MHMMNVQLNCVNGVMTTKAAHWHCVSVFIHAVPVFALIQQNDKMVEDVQQIKFNDLLTRFDVDHYNNILKNFEKE